MENLTLKEKLGRYIDACFPIIYINSYEEEKIDRIIKDTIGKKNAYEWNSALGILDFKSKERYESIDLEKYLTSIIDNGVEDELY